MADRRTNTSNSFQTALSFDLPQGGTTIEVEATAGSPGIPFYLVIDADVDAKREIVLVDASKDVDTFNLSTPDNRGVDGTLDVAHTAGALVGCYPISALWVDINDRVDAVQSDHDLHDHDGADAPAVSLTNISGHDKAAHNDFRDVGEVWFYAGTSVPSGNLEANGQAVSRTTYDELFAEIGTTWGAGDGTTTFNVPDLSDAVPVGRSLAKTVGSSGGAETHTHGNPSVDLAGGHTHTQANSGLAGSHAHTNPTTADGGVHAHSGASWFTSSVSGHAHSNPNVNSNGGHAHSSAGGHSHSSAGSHSHSTGSASNTTLVDSPNVVDVALANHSHSVSTNGSHGHGTDGNHGHGTDGNHAHSQGNTGSGGGHAHSVPTSNTGGSHGHTQANTGSNGDHAHTNPTTDTGGSHAHTQAATDAGDSYPPYATLMALIRF